MIFEETPLPGAYVIDLEPKRDERGFFARAWCTDELAAAGLDTRLAQINIGFSHLRGTVRGLHFQDPPHAEVKIVRCTMGAVYDVIVDLRPGSATRGQWRGFELTAENRRLVYVPEGFAHGYQTLTDATELWYQTSVSYVPESARGVRYDDPAFDIEWPETVTVVAEADRTWPDFDEGGSG